jgi:hypothetical protein
LNTIRIAMQPFTTRGETPSGFVSVKRTFRRLSLPLLSPTMSASYSTGVAVENIPVYVRYRSQSVRAAVATAMEFPSSETIAAARHSSLNTSRGTLQTAAETQR